LIGIICPILIGDPLAVTALADVVDALVVAEVAVALLVLPHPAAASAATVAAAASVVRVQLRVLIVSRSPSRLSPRG
jgi:hypothetical protein